MRHGANIFERKENQNCNIVNIYFCKNPKMRNMKSLHIFQFIIIKREEKFQESLGK